LNVFPNKRYDFQTLAQSSQNVQTFFFSFNNKLTTLNFHYIFCVSDLSFDTYLKIRSLISLLWIYCDSWAHIRTLIHFFFPLKIWLFFEAGSWLSASKWPSAPERILPDVTLRPENDLIRVEWEIERKPRKSPWTTERVKLLLNIFISSTLTT